MTSESFFRADLMHFMAQNRKNNHRDLLDRAIAHGPEMSHPALMLLGRLENGEPEIEPCDGTRESWSTAVDRLVHLGFASRSVRPWGAGSGTGSGMAYFAEITPKGREWFRL